LTLSTSPRIVFAGTSPFAVPVLQTLFDAGYPIPGVVTQPDKPAGRGRILQATPVKVRSLELNLPVHQPATLKSDETRRLFEALAPELLVVVAYGRILPPWLLALPKYGAVNLHASLLPRYRGAAPIQWAMANGDCETGVCAMKMDAGLDTGPTYACESTPISPDESVQQLAARLSDLGSALIRRSISGIVAGTLPAVPQDNGRATLAPILRKEDGVVDWSLTARTIYNRNRAFHPWPGTTTTFRDSPFRILHSRVLDGSNRTEAPGTLIVETGASRHLSVVCGEGTALELLEVQLPNRKPQTGIDFVNGFRVATGEKFARAG
jgi:methionyl-tRNA formyltransferase